MMAVIFGASKSLTVFFSTFLISVFRGTVIALFMFALPLIIIFLFSDCSFAFNIADLRKLNDLLCSINDFKDQIVSWFNIFEGN